MNLKMNKIAIITGGTSGIGKEFTKILASKGYDLIVQGRNEEILKNIKFDLEKAYKIKVEIYSVELTNEECVEEFYKNIEGLKKNFDIFINNAGLGHNGEFLDLNFEKHNEIIDVNIRAATRLLYLIANQMKTNRQGKILNVASTGAFQAGPIIASYYASKAYMLSLSIALQRELKEFNISVTTLCPGATKTKFCKRAGKADIEFAMLPEEVALIGYKAMIKNKNLVVPGIFNKLAIKFSRLVPYTYTAKIVEKIQRKVMNKVIKS